MPLYAEKWIMELAGEILGFPFFRSDPNYKGEPKILQVFAGMGHFGIRVDLNPETKPDFLADVHGLDTNKEFQDFIFQKIGLGGPEYFDIVFADPPYSDLECLKLYPTTIDYPKLNYAQWTKAAGHYLKKGGLLIVYHKAVPANPDPDHYSVEKRVFIGNRVNHVPRVAIFFRKK